ncbi:MAG: RHS repeat-associated core domain-containing protein, partial [Planctomycetes bacterium]|nr:RHS repeat-associated core domain-containing protein [Planctomycetota bacterium]
VASAVSQIGNAFAWRGLPVDHETGLVYSRNRYLNVELGRFMSQDPLGAGADWRSWLNSYNFGSADPLAQRDPSGLYTRVFIIESSDANMDKTNRVRAKNLIRQDPEGGEIVLFNKDGSKFIGPMPEIKPVHPDKRPCDPIDYLIWQSPSKRVILLSGHGMASVVVGAGPVGEMMDPKIPEDGFPELEEALRRVREAEAAAGNLIMAEVYVCYQALGVENLGAEGGPSRRQNLATLAADNLGVSVKAYEGMTVVDGWTDPPFDGEDGRVQEILVKNITQQEKEKALHRLGVYAKPTIVAPASR